MAVTIQQIAERAGVSRGTVDRALNHRGRINSEVAKRIQNLAKEMGYVSKEKKAEKRIFKIGVITQLAKSSFMLEVNRGICEAKAELIDRGVSLIVKEGISVDETEQLCAIEELVKEGIAGLAIMPVESEAIRKRLNWLTEEKKIPVVTFNSDIVGTKRICFVGMDNRRSGNAAAGLMGMLTRGIGKVLIITGFFSNNVNSARVDGFIEELKKSYPELEVAGVQGSFDDAEEVKKIIGNTMLSVPKINGIFMVSGGQEGIEPAFRELQIEKRPYMIIYDLTPENRKILEQDTADFLIDQNGYVQGYEPAFILADLVIKHENPDKELHYTDINIKTKYNM